MPADSNSNRVSDQTNALLAAIVEGSDDAIIGKDLRGIITSWNPAAERIFGYSAAEAIGQSLLMIIPADRQSEEVNLIERLQRGERIVHFETIRRAKDGHLVDVSLTISPIRDSAGKIVGASKIAREIAERKQVQRQMERAQKKYARDLEKKVEERTAKLQAALTELETFSYSVSHDLRAPLRAMEQYARVLMEDYGDKLDENAKRYLERIITAGARLDSMIRDLLAYSRVVRAPVEFHPVAVEPLVRDVIASSPALQPPQADVQIVPPLAPVLANELFLTQCVVNLLSNAVKFIQPGVHPQVRVWTDTHDHKVRLWVQDNGIGIAREYHARIFSMFERLNAGQAYEGTGIGLAIVRKAVERMGGSLGLESGEGNGSKFWIELPEAAQAEQARGTLA